MKRLLSLFLAVCLFVCIQQVTKAQISDPVSVPFIVKEVLSENLTGSLVTNVSRDCNPDTVPPVVITIQNTNAVSNQADTITVRIKIDTEDRDTTYTVSVFGSARYINIPYNFSWPVTKGSQRGTIPANAWHVRIDTLTSGTEVYSWTSRIPLGQRVWSNDTTMQKLVR